MRLLIMLGYPDSNQERQDQNLQCYHYTIAQYFAQKRCKDTAFLRNTNFLAYFLHQQPLKINVSKSATDSDRNYYFCKSVIQSLNRCNINGEEEKKRKHC